jgi:3-phosphoshikimate 1-carboxyvinyltransferase
MDLLIGQTPDLRGSVSIPPNKSHSFRALLMASLASGTSRIKSPAVSKDWLLGTEALEMFGASVEPAANDTWEVKGTGGKLTTPEDVINAGNSGIILRFFSAIAACCPGHTVVTGDHSLRHIRPIGPLVDAINQLGAWAVSTKGDGHAPIVIRGPLHGGQAELDGQDSQPVSALLIAASQADAPTELKVRNPGEKPWVGVTLEWLDRCGVEYSNDNYETYRIRGHAKWDGFDYAVPLDWSAALYPIVAGLLVGDGEVRVPGMDPTDSQGDKAVIDILKDMGADIEIENGTVIARPSTLTGRTIDCNDFIDQLPLLAVVGAAAKGETTLTNAAICRQKECDRITETVAALKAMGADAEERDDGLVVRQSRLHGASLNSKADHRMVMTFAVAGLTASGRTVISDIECVRKTFPHFVDALRAMGADVVTQ